MANLDELFEQPEPQGEQTQLDMLYAPEPSASERDKIVTDIYQNATGDYERTLAEESGEVPLADLAGEKILEGANYIIDGLDYMGNIMRSGVEGGLKGGWKLAGQQALEATTYDKRTTAEDLRKVVAEKMGTDRYGFNMRKGEFDAGDVMDFAMDVGIDVALDPLAWISLGFSSAIKKGGKEAAKAATEKVAKETKGQLLEGITKQRKQATKQLQEVQATQGPKHPLQVAHEKNMVERASDVLTKTKNYQNLDSREMIELADNVGTLTLGQKMRLQEAATAAVKATGVKGQAAKDMFANTMVGLYNTAAMMEDDDTIDDVIMDFGIGFVGMAGARKHAAKPLKAKLSKIGEKLNRAVGPNKPVLTGLKGPEGVRYIEVDGAHGHQMASIAADAATATKQAEQSIGASLIGPFRALREGKYIDDMLDKNLKGKALDEQLEIIAGDTFTSLTFLRDKLVETRNQIWDEEMAKQPLNYLTEAGLTKIAKVDGKEKVVPLGFAEAKGEDIGKLKGVIEQQAEAQLYNADGTLKPAVKKQLMTDLAIENTDKVFRNIDAWNDAMENSLGLEKELIGEQLTKLLDKEGIYNGPEILAARRAAFEKRKPFETMDLIKEDDVNKAFRLQMGNPGMRNWVPTIGDRSFAATKQAAGQAEPKVLTARGRAKAAASVQENIKRDVLGRDARRHFLDQRSVETATEYLNTAEEALEISARNKAQNILNTIQKEAGSYMGQVIAEAPAIGQAFKQFNSLTKKGLLLGAYSWVKNNLWSNARQAFAKHGIMGAADAVGITSWHNGMNRDMWKLFSSDPDKIAPFDFINKDEMQDMMRRGILEPTHLKGITQRTDVDSDKAKFLWSEDTQAKIKERENNPVFRTLKKANEMADSWSRMIKTQQMGGMVEGMARGSTYQHTLKMLRAQDNYKYMADKLGKNIAEESIRRKATEITNDVFFDYGKLQYFERAFLRELVPFYSFYKQNLAYQTRALLDPNAVPRLATMARMGDGRYFATEPTTGEQRKKLPPFLSRANAFVRVHPETGEKKIHYSTSDASAQAWQMLHPEFWFKGDFVHQLNPLVKSLFEQAASHDLFRGESLRPQDLGNPQDPTTQVKYLFSAGYPLWAMNQIFNKAIQSTPSIHLDENNNPVTDEEYVSRIMNINSWLMSMYMGSFQQVGGQVGKVVAGKQDVSDAVMNLIGPWQSTKLIPQQEAQRIKAYNREKYEEMMEETNKKIRNAKRGALQRQFEQRLDKLFEGED